MDGEDKICFTNARLRNDLYCVEWDVKLYYTIPYRHMVGPEVDISFQLHNLHADNNG